MEGIKFPFVREKLSYAGILSVQSQGFTKIKKKTKILRVTDEGWNSQKQPSGQAEQKKKEKTPVSSS